MRWREGGNRTGVGKGSEKGIRKRSQNEGEKVNENEMKVNKRNLRIWPLEMRQDIWSDERDTNSKNGRIFSTLLKLGREI